MLIENAVALTASMVPLITCPAAVPLGVENGHCVLVQYQHAIDQVVPLPNRPLFPHCSTGCTISAFDVDVNDGKKYRRVPALIGLGGTIQLAVSFVKYAIPLMDCANAQVS